ncbi:MAG TPA: alpha/beta hydrolase [Bryobacteraceae bacterium]|jgi:phospholipase/carboxylesterase/glyoxalase family protein|nr:alpha/beta hydrolase [Bryobacteraceae bacterium]
MTPSIEPRFIHRFVPATQPDIGITLLLLHGTGGNENDLLPLGRELLPGAALLSLRGRVLENGMPRFFRRFAEGVFDVEDLKFQTQELNDFLKAAAQPYGLAPAHRASGASGARPQNDSRLVAVGYSNGANIAASLLLLHPHALAGAVLFRAMVPFTPDFEPNLGHTAGFLSGGIQDPIVPRENTEGLATMLTSFGADIELHWHPGGHELGQDDLTAAKQWLSRKLTALAERQTSRIASG